MNEAGVREGEKEEKNKSTSPPGRGKKNRIREKQDWTQRGTENMSLEGKQDSLGGQKRMEKKIGSWNLLIKLKQGGEGHPKQSIPGRHRKRVLHKRGTHVGGRVIGGGKQGKKVHTSTTVAKKKDERGEKENVGGEEDRKGATSKQISRLATGT